MDRLKSISLEKIEELCRKENDSKVKLQLLAVIHRKEGTTYKDIAEILRISVGKVYSCVQKFSADGITGLQRKSGSGGNRNYLTKEQEKQLKDKLEKGPMTTKEVWSCIKDSFGKEYHPNSIPRLLRRLGQSLITPRPRHYKANPRSGSAFRGHIKKVKFVEV